MSDEKDMGPAAREALNYANMQPGEMLQALGDNAARWADAFLQIGPRADWETMHLWFSNAIEQSTDVRVARIAHEMSCGVLSDTGQFSQRVAQIMLDIYGGALCSEEVADVHVTAIMRALKEALSASVIKETALAHLRRASGASTPEGRQTPDSPDV